MKQLLLTLHYSCSRFTLSRLPFKKSSLFPVATRSISTSPTFFRAMTPAPPTEATTTTEQTSTIQPSERVAHFTQDGIYLYNLDNL